MLDDLENRRLVRRIQNGDKAAFEQLVKLHYGDVLAYCIRHSGSREDGEDLAQEVFLKVVRTIYQYRCTGKFKNFLFTIAVNTCNDYFRKKAVRSETASSEGTTDAENMESQDLLPQEVIVLREDCEILYRHLETLNDRQRDTLLLYYFHGFKIREIARITGVPIATVKSRIRQGIMKLRKAYETEEKKDE